METWTQQTGFPLITIAKEGNIITASQKRFLVSPRDNDTALLEPKSPFNYKWYVPLSFYSDKDPTNITNIWMNMTNGILFLIQFSKNNPSISHNLRIPNHQMNEFFSPFET